MSADLLKQAAYTAGRHAASTGMPISACPYDPGDGQPEQVLALWWLRGYRPDGDGDQVASLSGAAREEFNRLHPRGFGGKFGHHEGHAEAGSLEGSAKKALFGKAALDSVPSKLTPGPKAHNGHYEGEQLDAPQGAGKVRALSQYEGLDYGKVNDFLRGRWDGQPGPGKLPPRDEHPSDRTPGHHVYSLYDLLTKSHHKDDLSVVDIAKEIDKTMAVSKLPNDVVVERTVRRGESLFGRDVWYGNIIDWDEPDFDKQDKQIDEHWNQGERPDLTGMQFRDFGYASTTVSPEITKAYADRYVRVATPLEGEPIVFRILVPAGTGAVALSPLEKGQEAEILLERGLTFEVVKDHGVDDEGVRRLDVRAIPNGE
jgi:hypothetical protein